MPSGEDQVLVLTADVVLVDAVRRLAAAAGVAVSVVDRPVVAQPQWAGAAAVLVGGDAVEAVGAAGPTRRGDVHVLTRGSPPDAVFRAALACGAEGVLSLPADELAVIDLLAGAAAGSPRRGRVVAVLGGSGGVGATLFSAALSLVLANRGPTLLVDGDPLAAGIEMAIGLDGQDGARWDALTRPVGRLGPRALRETLPARGDLAALLWPTGRSTEVSGPAVRDLLRAARQAFDVIVVDVPRHPSVLRDEVIQRADRVLLVSRMSVPAVLAATRLLSTLPVARTAVVLRGRDGPAAVEAQRALGVPVLTVMRDQRRVDEDVALGLSPIRSARGPLARAVRRAAVVALEGA